MKLAMFYYNFIAGEFPENEEYFNITNNVFNYLSDAKFTDEEIVKIIINDLPNKDYIEINDLPNYLWDNSLLEENVFYYHKELQIVSPPPTWDKSYPFYLEMHIRYTKEDILNYFTKTFNIREEWTSTDKEIGSINYLLNKYKMFNFISPVDYMLHLIDYVSSLGVKATKIYDICEYEIKLAELLEIDIKQSVSNNKNNVVWRK